MNAIRGAISLFLIVLIAVASRGWVWTGQHQGAAQSTASRTVLTICILAAIAGLAALWRPRSAQQPRGSRNGH